MDLWKNQISVKSNVLVYDNNFVAMLVRLGIFKE